MARSPSPRRSGAAQPEMASLTRSIRCLYVVTRPPTQLLSLGDDILLEIFLRIDSFADLACASSACSTFRRIIAGRSFLRRYRSLHPPLLLGIIYYRGFQRAKGAHLNAAAAHVLSYAAPGFPFGYLPPGRWGRSSRWDPCDVRDGRVLLKSRPHRYKGACLSDLAVCDPIFQRYFLLPPITDDLLASVQIEDQNLQCFHPALVPAGDDDDETSFKVIGWTYCATKTVAFVFSRCSGSWIVGTSICWDALGLNMPQQYYSGSEEKFHYAYGCFFWKVGMGNKLLKLDMKRMKFSKVDLPPEILNPAIVAEAGENKLVMVGPIQGYCRDLVYFYTTPQNENEGANVWQVEDTVTVPLHRYLNWYVNGATEGYISLLGATKDRGGSIHSVCFSLESRTMKFERVNAISGQIYGRIYPYFRFPVFMSPRRI